MKPLIAFWIILIGNLSFSQQLPNGFGFSMFAAENGVAKQDAFATWNNTANMYADSLFIGISAQSVFDESLINYNLSAQIPTKFAPIGFGVNQFGDELMNETTLNLGVKQNLSDDFSLGVGIIYSATNAQFAETESILYPQVSMAYRYNETMNFGFTARNPFSQDYKAPFDENLQAFYAAGFHYQPSEVFSTSLQADIWEKEGLAAGLGLSYTAFDKFTFSLGGKTNPGFITAGLSVNLSRFDIGIGGKHLSPLGTSPSMVMQTSF